MLMGVAPRHRPAQSLARRTSCGTTLSWTRDGFGIASSLGGELLEEGLDRVVAHVFHQTRYESLYQHQPLTGR